MPRSNDGNQLIADDNSDHVKDISKRVPDAIEMTEPTYKSTTDDPPHIFPFPESQSETRNLLDRWRKVAIAVSWISVILSLLFGILLFAFSLQDSSSAAFGFAITALLDAFTSLVVIWRFYGALSAYSKQKENKALVVLGILLVLSAISTTGKTLYSLVLQIKPDFSPLPQQVSRRSSICMLTIPMQNDVHLRTVSYFMHQFLKFEDRAAEQLIVTSVVAAITMMILAVSQLFVAKKLNSFTLLTDGINSFSSAFVALSLVISYRIGQYRPSLWYLDEIAGIVIGCFLFVYGVILLVKYVPVLTRSNAYEETT